MTVAGAAPLALAAGAWRAVLWPAQGATIAALTLAGRDLIVPIPAGGDPTFGFHGAFWMAPWTNRLEEGRLRVGDTVHAMPINRPAEGHALHGFLRELPWQVVQAAPDRAELACTFARAPFDGTAQLSVALTPAGLALGIRLTHGGAAPLPMGLGWHPFFTRPAGTRLRFAATTVFGRDARFIAAAPRPGRGLDGDEAVLDGLDTHFAGWDGAAEITRPDGIALALRAEGAWARNLQVFAPQGGGVLCVEPVSHAPAATTRADNAAHGAMRLLAPGETLAASLMIHRI